MLHDYNYNTLLSFMTIYACPAAQGKGTGDLHRHIYIVCAHHFNADARGADVPTRSKMKLCGEGVDSDIRICHSLLIFLPRPPL